MPYYPNLEPATGGIPLAPAGAGVGALVAEPGDLQFGDMLLGGSTAAGWLELTGWRSLPGGEVADASRPQAHGSYPGAVLAEAATVTFTCLVQGTPEAKATALATIEAHTRMDGVERPLVVDDGDGPWLRSGRVVFRDIPQDIHYRHAPTQVAIQWVCADPRRYSLDVASARVSLPTSEGGLVYPLTYPLDYGTFTVGGSSPTNTGSEDTPLVATFRGPLSNPVLTCHAWSMSFDLTLAGGETLVVDTNAGTARLNGTADRLYTLTTRSAPLERCLLPPGATDLTLTATAGTGWVDLTYRHARM